MVQKESQNGFKMIKLKSETVNDLDSLIKAIEKKYPYLENILSYNSIIKMLMLKNKIKLSKLRYLYKVKKEDKKI